MQDNKENKRQAKVSTAEAAGVDLEQYWGPGFEVGDARITYYDIGIQKIEGGS
jgi:hypothetical protein